MAKASVNDYRKIRRNQRMTEMALQGINTDDIGKEIGLSGGHVRNLLATDERCRQILDDVHRVNILRAKGINRRLLKLCYDDDKKISLDAIKHHNKITRITPTHTPGGNTVFNQIYNDNRGIPVDQVPRIMEALEARRQLDLSQVIDIGDNEPSK